MKIFSFLTSGAIRSVKAWKGILIIWVLTLFLISLLALPMKAGIKNVVGDSMITELLTDGINIDVFTDFGSNLGTIISSISAGFLLVFFLGFLMNVFLAGGVFSILRTSGSKPSASQFFARGASNFWSFLVITLISSFMIMILCFIIIGIPLMIVAGADTPSEGAVFKAGLTFALVFALILPVFILVADYARAWQVSKERNAGFKAIGFGFRQTFRTFLSSYPLMIILLIVQVLYGWLVLSILPGMKPVTGGGVFLLFILSQFLFLIKILLKAWRYASVTSLMEQNS
jgi:hypothetical protein